MNQVSKIVTKVYIIYNLKKLFNFKGILHQFPSTKAKYIVYLVSVLRRTKKEYH